MLPEIHREAPELQFFHDANEVLDSPEVSAKLLTIHANNMAGGLAHYLDVPLEKDENCQPLLFELEPSLPLLFDPDKPTIAIEMSRSFGGSSLLGIAAQETQDANILYFTSETNCGHIATNKSGESSFQLTRAVMVSKEGAVCAGELPIPLTADAVYSGNPALITQCEARGIAILSQPDHTISKLEDVSVADELGISRSQLYTLDELEALWQNDPYAEVVIKPAIGSQGRGVRMIKGAIEKDAANTYYDFLHSGNFNYQPIIESRIKSWPIYDTTVTLDPERDPQDFLEAVEASRLDWNARAILCEGELIDMYIRLGEWGGPVNRSKGAQAILLSELSQYVDEDTATYIQTQLIHAGKMIAKKVGTSGTDLTIDHNGKVVLFENNYAHFGGLQTIASLHKDRADKLRGAHAMLAIWAQRPEIQGKYQEVSVITTREKLAKDFYAASRGLSNAHEGSLLAAAPKEVLDRLQVEAHARVDWWNAQYLNSPFTHTEITRRFFEDIPLEFGEQLPYLTEVLPLGTDLSNYIALFKEMLPLSSKWMIAQAIIWAEDGNFKKTRIHFAEILALDSPAYATMPQKITGALLMSQYKAAEYDLEPENADPCGLFEPCLAYVQGDIQSALDGLDRALETFDPDSLEAHVIVIVKARILLYEHQIDEFLALEEPLDYVFRDLIDEFLSQDHAPAATMEELMTHIGIGKLRHYILKPLLALQDSVATCPLHELELICHDLMQTFRHAYNESEENATDFAEFFLAYITGDRQKAIHNMPHDGLFSILAEGMLGIIDPIALSEKTRAYVSVLGSIDFDMLFDGTWTSGFQERQQ